MAVDFVVAFLGGAGIMAALIVIPAALFWMTIEVLFWVQKMRRRRFIRTARGLRLRRVQLAQRYRRDHA